MDKDPYFAQGYDTSQYNAEMYDNGDYDPAYMFYDIHDAPVVEPAYNPPHYPSAPPHGHPRYPRHPYTCGATQYPSQGLHLRQSAMRYHPLPRARGAADAGPSHASVMSNMGPPRGSSNAGPLNTPATSNMGPPLEYWDMSRRETT
ncbi:hypothetical protein H2248_002998 [Termitomyces sp. 'cryptogamus']|nr:hypothetical protein H2248_002998 [Termitomyces sp. 'cryptogamus']